MKFSKFCSYLDKIENESSRNEMSLILAELIKNLSKDEVRNAIYLLLGRTAPLYVAQEFNFSARSIIKSLAKFSGKDTEIVTKRFKEIGDLGNLTEEYLAEQKGSALDINAVHSHLEKLARISGKNSQKLKQDQYIDLLKKCSEQESRYIGRIIGGDMRLGLSLKTLFQALSISINGDNSFKDQIEYAYGVKADPGLIAEILKESGINTIADLRPEPGIPIASKLVERESSSANIIKRVGECLIQPKFDGLRVQIHFSQKGFFENTNEGELPIDRVKKVRIFSRNMEDMTDMFPDVVKAIENFPVQSFIVDGEAIGIDNLSGMYMAFQDTIRRKRKHDVESISKDYPLQVNLFDIMELEGRDLTRLGLEERMVLLKDLIDKNGGDLIRVTEMSKVDSEEGLERLFTDYVAKGLEGIIAKSLNSKYDPGTRNYDWIKLKASSKEELIDTVDAVVMGYYVGTGARAKLGMGALLAGIYDRKLDRYVSLAKVGSGLSDEGIRRYLKAMEPFKLSEIPKNYEISSGLIPDVVISPKIVISIAADSISRSKMHEAAGFSLRFPRLIVFGRDKAPEDTTSLEELEKMCLIKSRS
jgi:DNA ligase-1